MLVGLNVLYRRQPTCWMAGQLNKYIRCRAQKNTFVFLPGVCELFKMKAGERDD